MDLLDVWPLFSLRLVTPRLELRPVRDEDLAGLAEAALAGIHEPSRMPFAAPWTEAPRDELVSNLARNIWRERAQTRPGTWGLVLSVIEGGRPIGVQTLRPVDFGELRTVSSGSWLTRSRQGQGLGAEMRAGLLMFAFDVLGAEFAESGAYDWNTASLAVSAGLGYRENGRKRVSPKPGVLENEVLMRLEAAELRRPDWVLQVEGADAARTALGTQFA